MQKIRGSFRTDVSMSLVSACACAQGHACFSNHLGAFLWVAKYNFDWPLTEKCHLQGVFAWLKDIFFTWCASIIINPVETAQLSRKIS